MIEQTKNGRIADSGNRRQFYDSNGNELAVRDIDEGKGRCDLLPLAIIGKYILSDTCLCDISYFIEDGDTRHISTAINNFVTRNFNDPYTAMLEVSIHYKEGAEKKYGERNWEKGIPCHSFVDSAVRHYLKFRRGDTDERHDRAFLWNLLGLLWTIEHHYELNDLPYAQKEREYDKQ